MIQGIGIDIVKVDRIENIMERKGEKFLKKVFTSNEMEYIKNRNNNYSTIGGIFASKEAVSKVLGTGIGSVSWKDIEIRHDSFRKPYVKLHGNALLLMNKKAIDSFHLTITHEKEYIIALAIGEGYLDCDVEIMNKLEKNLEYIKSILPKREKNSHKGTYGRVGIVAGSLGMTGAPCLSSMAALRSGSGFVYTIVPKALTNIVSIKLTEAIIKPIEDEKKGHFTVDSLDEILNTIDALDAVALGPGIGVDEQRIYVVEEILKIIKKPIVLDADGLNCVAKKPEILMNRSGKTIITPHPGELSRLLGVSIGEIQKQRIKYCKKASEKYNVITVLKGANTIISTEKGEIYINNTGNPGMATAGSGDVLTGMINSFLGQGIKAKESAILGVYCHGLAGDLASFKKGEYGVVAGDILKNIPYAIKYIERL